MDIRTVAFCPHCNHDAPLRLAFVQKFETVLDDAWMSSEVYATYWLATCELCSQVILYLGYGSQADVVEWDDSGRIWPEKGTLAPSVPERVRRIYSEARAVSRSSPGAFAVQIRRCLEEVCRERVIAPAPLSRQLKRLGANGELPPVLAEMSGALRVLGNAGAHAGADEVASYQVGVIDEFFRAIVQYLYVAPAKVRRLREQVKERKD